MTEQFLKELGIMLIIGVGIVAAFGAHYFLNIWLPRKYGQRR